MGMPELDHTWLLTVGHILDFILRAFGNHVLSRRETKITWDPCQCQSNLGVSNCEMAPLNQSRHGKLIFSKTVQSPYSFTQLVNIY